MVDQAEYQASLYSFGRKGEQLDLSGDDVSLAENVKAIQVVAAGNLVYAPVGDLNNVITVTEAPVGFQPAHVVGKVLSAANGTTASVSTVAD